MGDKSVYLGADMMDNTNRSSIGRVTCMAPLRPAPRRPALNLAAAMIGLAAGFCAAESIKLSDGTVIQGEIEQRNDSSVTIRSQSLGTITLPVRELASGDAREPDRRESASVFVGDPSDQALLFMPTAFTPPAGSFTFRDFELFFLTMGLAPTDATSLTVGFLFPISSEFQILTAGAKQRLWQSADSLTAAALTANFTKPFGELGDDMSYFLNSNLVVGKRTGNGYGFHAALGYLGARTFDSEWNGIREKKNYEWNGSFTYAAGVESRLTPHVKFIAEYLSAVPIGTGADIDAGLLSLGIRLHGDRLSADIAGTRPIGEIELDDLFFWPLLVVSYRY